MNLLEWINSGQMPFLTVFLLGLVVSVCPCTIAANISALTCMLRQNYTTFPSLSAVYILARSISYTLVGVLLTFYVSEIDFTASTLTWIGKLAGPFFIIIGLFLLDIFHIHGLENRCVLWMNKIFSESYSIWASFLLGVLLAFAFCPYSAAIYFGLMVPLACTSEGGVLLPILFSIGAALPIIFLAWILYKGMDSKLNIWKGFQMVEYWFRKIVAVIFIITGLLFIWEYFIE
ncbi:MAG: sulfite exporter TauE/SafE family protein [Bacteroidales bacterium]|nr:sulfite exporter TauE/SafE family protein [Bacteroidales bacterium]